MVEGEQHMPNDTAIDCLRKAQHLDDLALTNALIQRAITHVNGHFNPDKHHSVQNLVHSEFAAGKTPVAIHQTIKDELGEGS